MLPEFSNSKILKTRYDSPLQIGEGGFGVVYRAHDKLLDKDVAIKIVKSDLSEERLIRFQQEAKILARLNHPNIQVILDFGLKEDNKPFLISELIDGVGLDEHLEKNGRLPLDEARDIFEQLCCAIEHAHSVSILHRDIKPSNIVLTRAEDGTRSVKVVDFGLARLKSKEGALTPTRRAIGSPLYMAPEQAEGRNISERSDIYSMGCVLFEMLSGEPPFCGETVMETLQLHKSGNVKSLGQFGCPPEIEDIAIKCIETAPSLRYDSISSIKEDLDAISQASDQQEEDPKGISDHPAETRPSRRKKFLWVRLLLFWAACLSFRFFSFFTGPKKRSRPPTTRLERKVSPSCPSYKKSPISSYPATKEA